MMNLKKRKDQVKLWWKNLGETASNARAWRKEMSELSQRSRARLWLSIAFTWVFANTQWSWSWWQWWQESKWKWRWKMITGYDDIVSFSNQLVSFKWAWSGHCWEVGLKSRQFANPPGHCWEVELHLRLNKRTGRQHESASSEWLWLWLWWKIPVLWQCKQKLVPRERQARVSQRGRRQRDPHRKHFWSW